MISAVVLAAGEARRFGGGGRKLVATLHGVPLVRRTIDALLAQPLDEIVVVTGAADADVRGALMGLPVRVAYNGRYLDGMSTSIRVGIDAVHPEATAVLIALADQPGAATVVGALIERYASGGAHIVVPSYAGTRGNPVLFDRSMLDELRRIEGDRGAREVIARDPARVAVVERDGPMPPDIDTTVDLARLEGEHEPDRPR
jgi:molybdenum cofactor cytidylyltransferase